VTPLSEHQATSAIYVDFESLGNGLNRPAILGVLVTEDGTDRFQQFVLDEALARAVVARKRVCVNATPEEAVTAIVEQAERERRIIG
jgi:hypothetical protein